MDENIKREIIIQHYQNPLNRVVPADKKYIKFNTRNESCIDNLDIYLKLQGDLIEDINFEGEACAISISSTSIMIESLVGKTIKEALLFIENFENMINEKLYDKQMLMNANVYDTIYKQASRKSCAYLPYKGLKQALQKYLKMI